MLKMQVSPLWEMYKLSRVTMNDIVIYNNTKKLV